MAKIRLVERIAPKYESFSPRTVRIGDQIWMAENLAIDDGEEGIYLNEENGEHYYTWEASARIAKSIPGWHLPSVEEWERAARSCGAERHPKDPLTYTNANPLKSKLNIVPAGFRSYGSITSVGSVAIFWTGTEFSHNNARLCTFPPYGIMEIAYNNKTYNALSVRLVKD